MCDGSRQLGKQVLAAPSYTFDPARLAILNAYNILDTPPERGFDDIVELATGICSTPVALVSLVANDRQWFKARVGFGECQTNLNSSVCAHALLEPDILQIGDLTQDPRTKDNPLVLHDPRIRFYAGVPLRNADGVAIGSLCVIDIKPRTEGLSNHQISSLSALARQVMTQLELRRAVADRETLLVSQSEAETRRMGLLHLGDQLRDAKTVAEITIAASHIIGRTLRADRAAFARFDETGEFLIVEPDWTAEGVRTIAGKHRLSDYGVELAALLLRGDALIIDDVATDPRTKDHVEALRALDIGSLVNVPIRSNGRTIAVLIVHAATTRHWPTEELTYLKNCADRVEVGVARIESEERQRLLNGELSHRMKNTMALVQAVASQTLRSVPDQTPVKAFSERVLALGTAHDLLLEQDWKSADFGAVVTSVACTFSDGARFTVAGPKLSMGSRATLSLSLLVHELTSNALKYGALSNSTGRVNVEWSLSDQENEPIVELMWKEKGGPPVVQPTRKGFGTRLITMGLVGTGGVALHYLPDGFEGCFSAPVAELQH